MNVLIVGRGRVGRALERALRNTEVGLSVAGRRARRSAIEGAELIILAVPDAEIANTAQSIAPKLTKSTAVVHCAGARGVAELKACKEAGAATGVMHPLASCPDSRRPPDLAGTTFLIHGDLIAVRRCTRIARVVGASAVVRDVDGPGYHAAAALVANGAAALAYTGSRILQRLGFSKTEADRALGGLLTTVGQNVSRLGTPDALTGPIVRGDVATVQMHRRALGKLSKTILKTYEGTGAVILECAKAAGLSRGAVTAIGRELTRPLRRGR